MMIANIGVEYTHINPGLKQTHCRIPKTHQLAVTIFSTCSNKCSEELLSPVEAKADTEMLQTGTENKEVILMCQPT